MGADADRLIEVNGNTLYERATAFRMEPGQGAYMPSPSTHMLENGDNASVTISVSDYTHATRRDSLLHAAHERIRGSGIESPAVGKNALFDFLLHARLRTVIDSGEWLHRSLGKQTYTDGANYVIAA